MDVSAPIDQPDFQNPQSGMQVFAPLFVANFNALLNPGGPFDLSGYQSLVFWNPTLRTDGHLITFVDPDFNAAVATITTPPDAGGNNIPPVIIPIRTKRIEFTTNTLSNQLINLYAVSRAIPHVQPAADWVDVDDLSRGSASITVPIVLGYGKGGGHAFMELGVSGATVTGSYQVLSATATMTIADTGEMHTNPFGGRSIYKEVTLPRGVFIVQFTPFTTGTAALNCRIVYGG